MSKKKQPRLSKEQPIPEKKIIIPWSLVIIALAAIIRIIYFLQFQNTNPVYDRLIHDSALFNNLAQNVTTKGLILEQPFYISPFYIYFLAFVYKIFGFSINAVRFVQFISGILTVFFSYKIAKHFFNKTTSIVTGFFCAFYMPFIFYESNLVGTSMATFLFISSFYSLLKINSKKLAHLFTFLSGLTLALAITSRPNLLLLVPAFFAYIIIEYRKTLKKALVPSLILFFGLAIPLLLTGIHNKISGDSFSILTTHGGINFYIGNHQNASGIWEAPEGLDASVSAINLEQSKQYAEHETGKKLSLNQVSQFWYNKSFSFIFHHPIQWTILTAKKTLLFWSSYETPLNYNYYFHQRQTPILKIPFFNIVFIMPFAIAGLIVLAPQWKKYWLLYSIVLLSSTSIIIFFIASRYRIVMMPFLIILASVGIINILSIFKKVTKQNVILLIIVICLFTGQIAYNSSILKKSTFSNEYYNLALSYLIDDKPERSIYWGKLATYQDPGNSDAFYNLGVANLKLKKYDDAYDAFYNVVQLSPDRADAMRNLASLLLMRKQYNRANKYLIQSINIEPNNLQALMNLGLSYYFLKDYDNAIDAWKKFLEIEPNNEQAKKNIQTAEYERDH